MSLLLRNEPSPQKWAFSVEISLLLRNQPYPQKPASFVEMRRNQGTGVQRPCFSAIAATFLAIFDNGGLLQLLWRKSGPVFHVKLLLQMWHEIGSRLVTVSFLALFEMFLHVFYTACSEQIFGSKLQALQVQSCPGPCISLLIMFRLKSSSTLIFLFTRLQL